MNEVDVFRLIRDICDDAATAYEKGTRRDRRAAKKQFLKMCKAITKMDETVLSRMRK